MKLHLASGSIYLDDFVNVDVPSPQTFLASSRPDLVEQLRTTEDHYYARHADISIDSMRAGPLNRETVCDRYGSFEFLPVNIGEVEHVLIRQAFEHLSLSEARRALDLLRRTMKSGSLLTLDVPDHVGTLKAYQETGDAFFVRHLLGPRRGDDFGHHVMSYEPHQLKALVEDHGFRFIQENPNVHLYPSICQSFRRI